MAAFIVRGYRLISSRHSFASFGVARNVKCKLQALSLPHSLLRQCSSGIGNRRKDEWLTKKVPTDKIISRNFGSEGRNDLDGLALEEVKLTYPFVEKVLTDDDADVHNRICGMIIGKGGENLRRIMSGLYIKLQTLETGHVLISGPDDEVVKKAVEKVTQEVQRIQHELARFVTEKVLTDDDVDVHKRICGRIIGQGGENIRRLESESGLDFKLNTMKTGHVLVSGIDAEVVKKAVEKVAQEIQRIQHDLALFVTEKVLTDDDADVHNRICGMIIGKGGENIRRLQSETGLDFKLNTIKTGHVLVSGLDAEVVKKAVEKVTQEVQSIKSEEPFEYPITEKVFTDNDVDVHYRICGMIIGKEGFNIKRLQSETGLDFKLQTTESGHVLVCGSNTETMKSAVEIINQEVQAIKTWLDRPTGLSDDE